MSDDIDIFHDREERVSRAAEEDCALLRAKGLDVIWLRREPAIYTAEIRDNNDRTHLEWVVDSDFRFFPTVKDKLFGYVLHPVDIAANKVMAAAGRKKPADVIDLLAIHKNILQIGALAWAAVEKAPGFTPEGLIAEIRRNANYRQEELLTVQTIEPVNVKSFYHELKKIFDEAEAFVMRMPTEKAGLLFLKNGIVVQPDPDHLNEYMTHDGKRRGHWPSNTEISRAMFEHYKQ